VSSKATYCIGKKIPSAALPAAHMAVDVAEPNATVAHLQIVPAEMTMKSGETAKFKVRLFDDRGRFIREERNATWALEGLKGTAQDNRFTPAAEAGAQGGKVKATVGEVTGLAQLRVFPPLPLSEDFESVPIEGVPSYWIGTQNKYNVRELEGNKVLVKNPVPEIFKRTRSFFGPIDWSNFSTQADVRATEKRRQMGDAGVVAQRYELVIFGNTQKMEIQSWQAEGKRTVTKPFNWKPDTWYRLKIQVENLPDGKVRARGKAWAVSEPEPSEWMIERIDPIGIRSGTAGIFADAPNPIYFDNIRVTPNK
jgi:hypothetical protein